MSSPADDGGVEDLLETMSRCPHCRASVRTGAPWCTLCHADLRPPPPEPVTPAPNPAAPPTAPAETAADLLTAPAAALGLRSGPGSDPTWPCSRCGTPNAIALNACASCGAGFLAGLRESEGPLLELPVVGDLTRMNRGQRIGIAAGVVLAFALVTALLTLLLG